MRRMTVAAEPAISGDSHREGANVGTHGSFLS